MKIIDLGRLWRSLTSSTVGYTSDAGLLVVYDIIATLNAAEASCERAGPSRATVEPGKHSRGAPKHFCGAPLGKNFLNFFESGAFWCTLYSWATAGPPNVAGPGVAYPSRLPHPLDGPANAQQRAVKINETRSTTSSTASDTPVGRVGPIFIWCSLSSAVPQHVDLECLPVCPAVIKLRRQETTNRSLRGCVLHKSKPHVFRFVTKQDLHH